MHLKQLYRTYFLLFLRNLFCYTEYNQTKRLSLWPDRLADAKQNRMQIEREGKTMDKRLYKSNTNKTIAGVCGGIGEYFNIDPTLIRLVWVVFGLAGGSGVLAYIIAALIIPNREFE